MFSETPANWKTPDLPSEKNTDWKITPLSLMILYVSPFWRMINDIFSRRVPISILPATMSQEFTPFLTIGTLNSKGRISYSNSVSSLNPLNSNLPPQRLAHNQVTRLIKQETFQNDSVSLLDTSNCSSTSSTGGQGQSFSSGQSSYVVKATDSDDGRNSPEKKQRQRWTSQEDFTLADLVRKNGQDEVSHNTKLLLFININF